MTSTSDARVATPAGPSGPAEVRSATVTLTIGGRKLHLEFEAPTAPTRPVALLPLFQSITDAFVRIATEDAEADGATISCRKGCGACCRQLVPISPIEVEAIRALVEALPEQRRRVVIERFEKAVQALQAAGLLDALRAPQSVTRGSILALGDTYFAQGIACPFLEEESCSIHADRPLACREYLVTSPAANCAEPTAASIRCVAMPAKVSRAVRHLDAGVPGRTATWIPMILALEWPLRDDAAVPPPGTASVATVFEQLCGTRIPGPDEPLSEPPRDA